MSPPGQRQRPRVETEGAARIAGEANDTSLATTTDLPLLTRRPDYGVLVTAERADGAVASQVYRNLGAAERKRTRCHERGLRAELLLVRLVPVGVLPLAVPALEELLQDGGPR